MAAMPVQHTTSGPPRTDDPSIRPAGPEAVHRVAPGGWRTTRWIRSIDRVTAFRHVPSGSPLVPVGIFVCCLAWRSPRLLLAPRFLAEEGNLYYGALQHLAPSKGLVRVFNGNYQFLTNALVELSLRVPVRYAAHVTTYLSLAVAVSCCWVIARLLLSRGCSSWAAAAACALFALQPGGYEVFLSATNVQWASSVLALGLALSEDRPARGARAVLVYALLLVCGLTGTTSCILLPLFLAGALWRRSAFGWAMAAVLGAATAVEGAVVLVHHAELQRPFTLSSHMLLPEIFQVFYAQLLPAHVMDALEAELLPYDGLGRVTGLQIVLVGLAGMAGIAHVAARRLGRFTAGLLLAGALLVPLVNEYGALAGVDEMLSGWAGGRYFFLGASCTVILMAACLDAVTASGRAFGAALVCLALLNGIATAATAEWTALYLTGPSVAEEVDRCGDAPRCTIRVWPVGNAMPLEVRTSR